MNGTRGRKEMMLSKTVERLAEEKSARLWQGIQGVAPGSMMKRPTAAGE
jgi:hypothetical protein